MQKMLFAEITFGMTDTYMEEKKKKKDKERADVRKKRSTTSNR